MCTHQKTDSWTLYFLFFDDLSFTVALGYSCVVYALLKRPLGQRPLGQRLFGFFLRNALHHTGYKY